MRGRDTSLKEKKMASNPLLKFRDDILRKIIYPKLYGIIFEHKGDISQSNLWKEFREKHDCSVSLREFKEWMNDLGLQESKVTSWNCPEGSNPVQIETANGSRIPNIQAPTHDSAEAEVFAEMMGDKDLPDDPSINFDNE